MVHLLKRTALDFDQRLAVNTIDGPLMILAGPGSGKTRTLLHRIENLIRGHKVPPEKCLCITVQEETAKEIQELLEILLPNSWASIPVMTFRDLGHKILQENRLNAGLPRGFRIASLPERTSALSLQMEVPALKAEEILKKISEYKKNPSLLDSSMERSLLAYEHICQTKAWIDDQDLLTLSIQLLENDRRLASHYYEKYPFISVDEFQELDSFQYKLLRLLGGPEGNVCVSGDPGPLMDEFQRDFVQVHTIHLTRNYHSVVSEEGS